MREVQGSTDGSFDTHLPIRLPKATAKTTLEDRVKLGNDRREIDFTQWMVPFNVDGSVIRG